MRWIIAVGLALWLAPAAARGGTINAVLGDASWREHHASSPPSAAGGERIVTHLAYVERRLRNANVRHLSVAQRERRMRLLDVLAGYRRAGVFPANDRYAGLRPRIRDEEGALCAVGHLIAHTGATVLLDKLAREQEWQYLQDVDDPGLSAWADEHGFAPIELAMIQPAYAEREAAAPPPLRPTRHELQRTFARLAPELATCRKRTDGAPARSLATLRIHWPASGEPVLFEAISQPRHAEFERCLAGTARRHWVRLYGGSSYAGNAVDATLRFWLD